MLRVMKQRSQVCQFEMRSALADADSHLRISVVASMTYLSSRGLFDYTSCNTGI